MNNATPQPLYLRERDLTPLVQEVGCAPGPVWTVEENPIPTGIGPTDCPARTEFALPRLPYPGTLVCVYALCKLNL
jgi:hypothetical protein